MIKKFFSLVIITFMINMTFTPVYADIYDDTVEGNIVEAEFVSDLDVNESSKNQIVEFKTTEAIKSDMGFVIPRGTILKGRIKARKKSRCFYRRAKVKIAIDEMKVLSGEVYRIKANTKRRVLKGSAVGNVAKGIVSTPVALIVGIGGTVVMLVEACTIIGIVALAPTGAAVGGTVGKLTNGVNCTKERGDDIKIRVIKTYFTNANALNQNIDSIDSTNTQNSADNNDEDFD